MFNKRAKDMQAAAQNVFSTPAGKKFLAYLKDDYLNASAKSSSPEETYYMLGKQDFAKWLISLAKDQKELDKVVLYSIEDSK